MAFGAMINPRNVVSLPNYKPIQSEPIDTSFELMLHSDHKHMCTLKTESLSNLLDSDCFKSKEAIKMSTRTRKNKAYKCVYQRGNTWSYVVPIIDEKTGKKKQKMVGGYPSDKAAYEALLIVRAEILSSTYIPESSMTFEKYLTNWFESYKKTLQPSTVQGYWNNLKLHVFPALGTMKLSKLNRTIITDFCYKLRSDGLSPNSIKYIFSTIRKALSEAVCDRIIPINPCQGAKRPKEDKFVASILDNQMLDTLLKGIKNSSIETEILLALFCGLRRGEVLGLRFKDCDFKESEIHVCQQVTTVKEGYGSGTIFGIKQLKTKGSNRKIVIPTFVANSILARKSLVDSQKALGGFTFKDNDLVSCNPDGSFKSPQTLLKQFKKLLKELNLPDMRFHDLRHNCASLLIENDVNLKEVSTILGHSSISITGDIYVDILNKKRQPADKIQAKYGSSF